MRKLIKKMKDFYVVLVGVFSILVGVMVGVACMFVEYPSINHTIANKNGISIVGLNLILIFLGGVCLAASIYYYLEATKEDKGKRYISPAT